jgi:hypothetical protein
MQMARRLDGKFAVVQAGRFPPLTVVVEREKAVTYATPDVARAILTRR